MYSLGHWDDDGRVERAPTPPSMHHRGYYHSHFFRGGQRCDETRKPRSTEVQFLCCGGRQGDPPKVRGIEETSTCKYVMQVCVPETCVPLEEGASQTSGSGGRAGDTSTSSSKSTGKGKVSGTALKDMQQVASTGSGAGSSGGARNWEPLEEFMGRRGGQESKLGGTAGVGGSEDESGDDAGDQAPQRFIGALWNRLLVDGRGTRLGATEDMEWVSRPSSTFPALGPLVQDN